MGFIHLYSGDGKGKTTAALGLAVRAAGRGQKVTIARFLKTDDSGEVPVLSQIEGITVMSCEKQFGFFFQMSDEQKQEARVYYTGLLDCCVQAAAKQCDLLILDEIIAAFNYDLIDRQQLLDFLTQKPERLEVVLTGRNPNPSLIGLADYFSEIQMKKHPFTKGIPARIGIEY